VFKKSVMPVLILVVAIIISLSTASNRAHAMNEPNLALNPNPNPNTTEFPNLTASFTCGCDSVWSTVNGVFSYNENPRDRWTN